MFNGNYIKIDTIVKDVQKYPFTEELTKREAAHSLVKLLGFTGATLPLERKYQNIQIDMHKGVLPKDIMYVHGVNNKGNSCNNLGIAMKYSSDIYLSVLHSEEAKKVACGTTINTTDQVTQIYPPTLEEGATTVTGLLWGDTLPAPALTKVSDIPLGLIENSYNINAMSIDTSFAYGWVEIAYDSIKTDDDGFPMIPDDGSFKEAFKYFLLKNAAEPAYLRGSIPRHIYSEIQTQYNWYVGQASNSFRMLSPDQMESMANGLLRIIPRRGQYKDGWKSFNKPE